MSQQKNYFQVISSDKIQSLRKTNIILYVTETMKKVTLKQLVFS